MCWLIYVASYVSRYSYNSNIVAIKDYYGVTNAVTGLVSTCFFFAYGAGQIINGLLCKRYNKKLFLSLPLFLSAAINMVLFARPPIAVYKYMWLLNGASLSILWSLLLLTLSENLDDKHLTAAMLVMSTTVAVGTVLSYGSSALFNLSVGFRYAFLTGAAVACAVGVIWIIVCDKLVTATEKPTTEEEEKSESETEKSEPKKRVGASVIMTIIVFGVFMTVGNLVKDCLTVWVPQILKDSYGFGDSLSIILTLVLPFLGLFGATLLVALCKVIKNGIVVNCLLFVAAGACVLGVMLLLGTDYYIPVIILFGLLSLLVHAINNYSTSFLPLKMRGEINSGFLAGILNACGYVGSTISAYCMGLVADKTGWNGVFVLLTALCAAVVAFSIPFIFITQKRQKKD